MSDSILSQGITDGEGEGDTTNAGEGATTDNAAPGATATDTNQQNADGGEGAGGEGSGDDKGGEKPAGAPEAYEAFNVPEGITYDAAIFEHLNTVAKDLNLSQDQAQAVVDSYYAMGKAAADKVSADVDAQAQKWADEVKADPLIGGTNFDATCKHVAEVTKAMPEFKSVFAALEQWGVGNHPDLVRAFSKLGKLFAEDQVHSGGTTATGPVDRAKVLYPNMN